MKYLKIDNPDDLQRYQDNPIGQYHILVTQYLPDIGRITSIEFNQTGDRVCRIVRHYYKFKFFICEHRSFHPAYITQILVYKADQEVAKLYSDSTLAGKTNTNSWKWNNLVLEIGKDVTNVFFDILYDQSLLEAFKFAKSQMITNSIDKIHDFCKVMIPLGSAFLTVYFALLKFLGMETIKSNISPPIDIVTLMYSPILFITSVIAFALAAFPAIFFGNIYSPDNIKGFTKNIPLKKYVPIAAGLTLFIGGLWSMVNVSIQILLK
jgi:hypothetical protein